MDISDVIREKEKLEYQIKSLVDDFEEKTKLTVTDISVNRLNLDTFEKKESRIVSINAHTKL